MGVLAPRYATLDPPPIPLDLISLDKVFFALLNNNVWNNL